MKKLYLIASSLIVTTAIAQNTEQKQFIKEVEKFTKALENKNSKEIVNLIHPDYFLFIPKEELQDFFEQTFSVQTTETYTISIKPDISQLSYTEIYKNDIEGSYIFADYTEKTKITFAENFEISQILPFIEGLKETGLNLNKISDKEYQAERKQMLIGVKNKPTQGEWKLFFGYNGVNSGNILTEEISEKANAYYKSITKKL